MMIRLRYFLLSFLITGLFGILSIKAQFKPISYCNSFDSILLHIVVDSNGIWEIGKPSKPIIDSSFSGKNSIVTSLDSSYISNDTSSFYVILTDSNDHELPNYLGYFKPVEISFFHRFLTDSKDDYGLLELSENSGKSYRKIMASPFDTVNKDGIESWHTILGSGDTVIGNNLNPDSFTVWGNATVWLFSRYSIQFGGSPSIDSLIFKFSFVSDNNGTNEGWQIDDICLFLDSPLIGGIDNRSSKHSDIKVYPNPSDGNFTISGLPNEKFELVISDLTGRMVLMKRFNDDHYSMSLDIPSGQYILSLLSSMEIYNCLITIE